MSAQETVRTYSPESLIRRKRSLIRSMWSDLRASGELARRLMGADLASQYRQSMLGYLWAFLPPLVMAVGFTLAGRSRILNVEGTLIPYPVYVIVGFCIWQTFIESLNGPISAVRKTKAMLVRVNFPKEGVVLAELGVVWFNFAVRMLLIVAVLVAYGVPFSVDALLGLVAVAGLTLLGFTIGLLLAPLGLLFEDVPRGLVILNGLWLVVTPVLYATPADGAFATVVRLNPVSPLLTTGRDLMTGVPPLQIGSALVVMAVTLVLLPLGWIALKLSMPYVCERFSA